MAQSAIVIPFPKSRIARTQAERKQLAAIYRACAARGHACPAKRWRLALFVLDLERSRLAQDR